MVTEPLKSVIYGELVPERSLNFLVRKNGPIFHDPVNNKHIPDTPAAFAFNRPIMFGFISRLKIMRYGINNRNFKIGFFGQRSYSGQ